MAVKNDIFIDQGTTFSTVINLVDTASNPINLTGYAAYSQMKKWYTSINSFTFTTAINAVAGQITLSMPANLTANITHGRYIYDVNVVDTSNNFTRVVEGVAVVTGAVTNASYETTANTYTSNNYVVVPLDG